MRLRWDKQAPLIGGGCEFWQGCSCDFTSTETRDNLFSRTAIVAPGGWATAKRPFSEFVAVRNLPVKRNTSLPICM